jgi:outer membrane protein OmpA-like peptidoglycan-associated protein
VQLGAGLGGEVRVAENWKLFANAKYYTASRYENLYGNIGIRYLLGKKQSKAEENLIDEAAEESKRLTEEAKLQEARFQEAKLQEAKFREEAVIEAQKKTEEEKAKRLAEEAKITKEISDEELAKLMKEAEDRRKRPMLKTYSLTTNFETNSYFLTDEFKEQIKTISQELNNYDYKKITIEGHTDSTGAKEVNKKLSRQRARSVYDEFIKAGVDAEKMSYAGFAATMPVKSNNTAEGRSANRRTEIFVE